MTLLQSLHEVWHDLMAKGHGPVLVLDPVTRPTDEIRRRMRISRRALRVARMLMYYDPDFRKSVLKETAYLLALEEREEGDTLGH